MTHILPPHTELNLAPSSLQSALQLDPNQPQLVQQPAVQQQGTPTQGPARKRKKNDGNSDEPATPAEPRRLRRSHEACARCRSKKIKCDSKHPRCSACATAGTACHQEDRHRQTLITRGHTERIEQQLLQCDALLKRYIPGFDLNNLDEILAREGIELTLSPNINPFQYPLPSSARPFPLRADGPQPSPQPPKGFYQPPPAHLVHSGYPHPVAMPYGPPAGAPFPPPPHLSIQGPYSPHVHTTFHHPASAPMPPPVPARPSSAGHDIKGQDPKSNDMSNTQALAKNFGVHVAIVNDLKLVAPTVETEDLAVGSGGLTSGRDREVTETSAPRDSAHWISITMRRTSGAGLYTGPMSTSNSVDVWLPKDRAMVKRIVEIYFTRLNFHRPVFLQAEFMKTLDDMYETNGVQHDPGYVCSLYLILALGTLSELNHRVSQTAERSQLNPVLMKKLMPADWPEHDELFERALTVKPDLRVTISSLQALILLHWYLYTERQGRTLWRLVGSLVRLSIELGLHHDPTMQKNTFTEEEALLRIRLWGIVMVHDRGTSILLGRPLAIAPFDSNTPHLTRKNAHDFSEHFLLSQPIAEIQADIINSLYTPAKQTGEALIRHATRIIKSMVEFRKRLPESYSFYFGGTDDWPLEKKMKLVQDITEDQGLTLLKIGISRILLLRALFSSRELSYAQRHKALVDAIITSHNIIIVHNQLIRFPDIAFFTSPIPLHIAAMVILYGHMSRCDHLKKQTAVEDLWMALDMLPRFRWRWERKDLNGGHPLIEKLAERVMEVNLHQVGPTANPTLMTEPDWDPDIQPLAVPKSQQTTPTLPPTFSNNGPVGGYAQQPPPRSTSVTTIGTEGGTPPDKQLVEVPTVLFYPFYPESQFPIERLNNQSQASENSGSGGNGQSSTADFTHLLATAVPSDGTYGCQPSQDSFMLEEKDTNPQVVMPTWMNVQGGSAQRGMQNYPMPQS